MKVIDSTPFPGYEEAMKDLWGWSPKATGEPVLLRPKFGSLKPPVEAFDPRYKFADRLALYIARRGNDGKPESSIRALANTIRADLLAGTPDPYLFTLCTLTDKTWRGANLSWVQQHDQTPPGCVDPLYPYWNSWNSFKSWDPIRLALTWNPAWWGTQMAYLRSLPVYTNSAGLVVAQYPAGSEAIRSVDNVYPPAYLGDYYLTEQFHSAETWQWSLPYPYYFPIVKKNDWNHNKDIMPIWLHGTRYTAVQSYPAAQRANLWHDISPEICSSATSSYYQNNKKLVGRTRWEGPPLASGLLIHPPGDNWITWFQETIAMHINPSARYSTTADRMMRKVFVTLSPAAWRGRYRCIQNTLMIHSFYDLKLWQYTGNVVFL